MARPGKLPKIGDVLIASDGLDRYEVIGQPRLLREGDHRLTRSTHKVKVRSIADGGESVVHFPGVWKWERRS